VRDRTKGIVLGLEARVRERAIAVLGPEVEVLFVFEVSNRVGAPFVWRRIRFFTFAISSTEVHVLNNRKARHPGSFDAVHPLSSFGIINDAIGDAYVELAGDRYFVTGEWSDQLRKLKSRL
jgi:hypothetical protein